MRSAFALALGLFGCDAPLGGDLAQAPGVELSPYAMPDRSGCTYAFDRDDGDDGEVDYRVEQRFDGADHLVWERVERAGIYVEESAWTYDAAGCLVAFDRVLDMDPEVGDAYDSDTQYVQTCDEAANVEDRAGTYNGEAFTVSYVNTYQQGALVDVSAILRWTSTGDVSVLDWAYAWEDGRRVSATSSVDGQPSELETWTYDGGGLLEDYAYQQYEAGEVVYSYAYAYTYDTHGRQLTQVRSTPDEGDQWRLRYDWYEDIYHTSQAMYDLGLDGEADQLLAYSCEQRWPWACLYAEDGEPDRGERPDGVVDASGAVSWRCE